MFSRIWQHPRQGEIIFLCQNGAAFPQEERKIATLQTTTISTTWRALFPTEMASVGPTADERQSLTLPGNVQPMTGKG